MVCPIPPPIVRTALTTAEIEEMDRNGMEEAIRAYDVKTVS